MQMTEKQMSLACWYWIYSRIKSGNFNTVNGMKHQYFIYRHQYFGLVYDCLFCTYCKTCNVCPISANHDASCHYYRRVVDYAAGMNNRKARRNALAGCLKIIEELNKFPNEGKTVEVKRIRRKHDN